MKPPAPEPTATSSVLTNFTSAFIVNFSTIVKTVVLTSNSPQENQSTAGRLVHIKVTPSGPPSVLPAATILCSTGVSFFPAFQSRPLSNVYCVTLQEYPANTYNLLNYYTDSFPAANYITEPDPSSIPVNLPGDSSSFLFVDLRTQSKAITLPSIPTLTSSNETAPYFMIKDSYGNAFSKNLFISTSGGATIEGQGSTIKVEVDYAALELLGDKALNRWHILNYFDGLI